VEEDAGAWQLQNEYISQAERPEWDEYLTRTPVYELTVGGQGVTPKRKFGGDWLARKAYQDSQVSGMLR
jgi:hypothetical protein